MNNNNYTYQKRLINHQIHVNKIKYVYKILYNKSIKICSRAFEGYNNICKYIIMHII